jgi:hypothetical protein
MLWVKPRKRSNQRRGSVCEAVRRVSAATLPCHTVQETRHQAGEAVSGNDANHDALRANLHALIDYHSNNLRALRSSAMRIPISFVR